MDSLRTVLLMLGLAFVAGMYVWYRIKQDDDSLKFPPLEKLLKQIGSRLSPAQRQRELAPEGDYADLPDEDIEHFPAVSDVDASVAAGDIESISAREEMTVMPGEELVIVLSIMAGPGKRFAGLDILDSLLAHGFVHGDMSIFHYFHKETDKQPVFSLANAVEPGTFDMDSIEALHTPGLSLFMQLPGPMDTRDAFEAMLEKGRAIAGDLKGELCDETRSVLTMQTIGHLKEEIEAWLFKQKMAHLRSR